MHQPAAYLHYICRRGHNGRCQAGDRRGTQERAERVAQVLHQEMLRLVVPAQPVGNSTPPTRHYPALLDTAHTNSPTTYVPSSAALTRNVLAMLGCRPAQNPKMPRDANTERVTPAMVFDSTDDCI